MVTRTVQTLNNIAHVLKHLKLTKIVAAFCMMTIFILLAAHKLYR